MQTSFLKINSHTKRILPFPPQKPNSFWLPLVSSYTRKAQLDRINTHKQTQRSQSLLLFLSPAAPQTHLTLSGSRGTHPKTALGTAQNDRGENILPQWCPHTWEDSAFQAWHSCICANSPGPRKGQKGKDSFCVWCTLQHPFSKCGCVQPR